MSNDEQINPEQLEHADMYQEPEKRTATRDNWQDLIDDDFAIMWRGDLADMVTADDAGLNSWGYIEGIGQENNIILQVETLSPYGLDMEGATAAKKRLDADSVELMDIRTIPHNSGYPQFYDYDHCVIEIVFRQCSDIHTFMDGRTAKAKEPVPVKFDEPYQDLNQVLPRE